MIEPYAFIRAHNEISTVKTCMESIQPVIKKGVIGIHPSIDGSPDDGTHDFLDNFYRENPGYKLIYYPYPVYPTSHPIYKNLSQVPLEQRLDSYYNAVLAEIPENEWLIKIDCVQIYHPAILTVLLSKNFDEDVLVWFGRYNLHYDFASKQLFNITNLPIPRQEDQWLIFNRDLHFTFMTGEKNGKFYAWEFLDLSKRNNNNSLIRIEYPIFSWHFPFIKHQRKNEDYQLNVYQPYLHPHLPEVMTDEQLILKICQNFQVI